MTNDYLQLGTVGILFALAIKEFFAYLKTRNNNGKSSQYEKDIAEIKKQLSNHVQHLREDIDNLKVDMKIMKNDINDIKIAINKGK